MIREDDVVHSVYCNPRIMQSRVGWKEIAMNYVNNKEKFSSISISAALKLSVLPYHSCIVKDEKGMDYIFPKIIFTFAKIITTYSIFNLASLENL